MAEGGCWLVEGERLDLRAGGLGRNPGEVVGN